jgi:non-haem Fe2+, alpha-ketoglutarate-dependent halogenase
MTRGDGPVLTNQQLVDYEELGFIHSIPILSDDEVSHYHTAVEKTCQAIGGRVTRLDGLHLFFRWAWDLCTHRRLLDCLEEVLGPDILLKSTRVFYKHAKSASYVGWHQDGITERLEDGRAPAVWLGLTAATVENGCLRVVPRSHRLGLLQHESSPDLPPLPDADGAAQVPSWSEAHRDELSRRITRVPIDVNSRFDIVMRPGEMSIHHPVTLHGSNPNVSAEPRIGLSASFSAPELYHGPRAVVWARGDGARARHSYEVIDSAPTATFEDAVAAYCSSDRQILFAHGEK